MTSVKFVKKKILALAKDGSFKEFGEDSKRSSSIDTLQSEYDLLEQQLVEPHVVDDVLSQIEGSIGEVRRISVIDSEYDKQYKNEFKSFEDDDFDDFHSSDDNSADSSITYIQQEELAEVPDFFAELGEVPDLDDISLSPIISDIKLKISETQLVTSKTDTGRFYDPMTGELLKSSSSESVVKTEDEKFHYENEEVEEEEDADDGFLLLQYEMDSETDIVQELIQNEEEQEEFFAMEQIGKLKSLEIDEEIDYEERQRQETARQVLYNTQQFLQNIIEDVIQYCENKTPLLLLRHNLDKYQLMQAIVDKLDELDADQKVRQFLNRKVVEHHRRKKLFRAISENNPDTMAVEKEKLSEAMVRLDKLLGKEEEITRVSEVKIFELEGEHAIMNKKSLAAVEKFDSLVRNTFWRDNFARMNASVDYHLKKINTTRLEISKLRYRLIQKQHTLANLFYKLEKMEQLGSGLHMRDFERLNAEMQALGRKMEERNAEWKKLILRRCSNLHIMAHMKERQSTMSQTISIQEVALKELRNEKQEVRQNLYDMKMTRARLRHEIGELSFQGGLLDKPALMEDYDETIVRLAKMRAQVEQSQEKHAALTTRIQQLELKTETSNDDVLYEKTYMRDSYERNV